MIDFWLDKWAGDEQLIQIAIQHNPSHFLVTKFFDKDGWNVDKLLNWIPSYMVP